MMRRTEKGRPVSRALCTVVAGTVAFGAVSFGIVVYGAGAQTGTSPTLQHERMPLVEADGLMAGTSDQPVLLFEDGAEPGELPSEILRDGERLPAPGSDVEGTGDDLLYRTSPSSGGPAPGTVHNVQREVRPDRQTDREPWLTYHAVFDPAVIPFKRNSSKDTVTPDGGLVIGQTMLQEVAIAGNRTEPGREVFWGSILVELEPGLPIPIPSVSPESRILSYEAVPDVSLRIFKDGADNFYVEAAAHKGRVRVNFVMDAPSHWFHHTPADDLTLADIPIDRRPELTESLRSSAAQVASAIGVDSSMSYAAVLHKLVFWFRGFAPGELEESRDRDAASTYVDLALGRKGVCRHRGYGFVITAAGLGIPARYVSNEAHVFVAVYVPRTGWMRIDLGGGAQGMNVRNSGQKHRHSVAGSDPFGFPPGFRDGYSQGALAGRSEDGSAGDPVRGLPPEPSGRQPGLSTTAGGGINAAWGVVSRFFGSPRNIPFAESAGRLPTRTSLEQVSAQVFRGEKLTVRGVVTEANGNVVANGRVRINLIDPVADQIVRVLGNVRTGATGGFLVSVGIPMEVETGTWEIVAEFTGDNRRASSRSD